MPLSAVLCVPLAVQLWEVKDEKDGKMTVEFLSTLTRHTRSVNIVRFSPDGGCSANFVLFSPGIEWQIDVYCIIKYTEFQLLS